ncbi:nectin-3-like protein isoform X2 [Mobula hypostoma]|uniref:nectin-3-like protein isoform X2 n=1 Tax=Mobula hypostoma TaxID=723540 RepID=UPI002FC32F54
MAGSEAPAPLLLWMLVLVSGALASPVAVDQKISAILGKNVTLKCFVTVKENVTQISWEKQERGTTDTVAVFHPKYGISIQGDYSGRAEFTNPSSKDATIVITKVRFSDSGNYICKVVTFPLGNYQETSTVTVIDAPEVTMMGYDGNWFVGRKNVQLKCKADANPSPSAYIWSRFEEQLPEDLQIENDTLTFNRPLNHNDSGIYICEVVNIHGHRKNQKLVQIKDPPTTTPLCTTAPLIYSLASVTALDGFTPKIQIPPSTLASLKIDNLGTTIGGVVGGTLLLMLVVVIIVMICLRRRRTFRGDYYTKQYAGTADVQKDSQMSVLPSCQIEPYTDYDKIERNLKPNNVFQNYPVAIQKSEWQNEDSIKSRYSEGVEIPIDYYEDQKICNASQCDYYDENEDDLVSHLDGSIISRREWYV